MHKHRTSMDSCLPTQTKTNMVFTELVALSIPGKFMLREPSTAFITVIPVTLGWTADAEALSSSLKSKGYFIPEAMFSLESREAVFIAVFLLVT